MDLTDFMTSTEPGQLAGIGALSSVFGSFMAASGRQSAYRTQSTINAINAKLAEQDAQQALFAGQHEEQQVLQTGANIKSAQRAGMAASGVDLSQGSPLNVQNSTDLMAQRDAITVQQNALQQAWGYRNQSTSFRIQSLEQGAAANAISPIGSAGDALLQGYGKVSNEWYLYNRANNGVPQSSGSSANVPIGGEQLNWNSIQ